MSNILKESLEKYIEIIKEKYSTSISSEHTLRTPLENLLNETKPKEIKVEHEAKKEEYENGTPDFKIFKQIDSTEKLTYPNLIGYIECKKLNEDLDKILKSEQIKKYLEVSPNIVLTDYNRFILLSFQKVIEDIRLLPYGFEGNLFSEQNVITDETVNRFQQILNQFYDSSTRKIKSKKELVKVLSSQAFYLGVKTREYIADENNQRTKFTKYFNKTYESFKEAVSYEFDMNDFCDIFGQSVVYGLFVAHIEREENQKSLDETLDLVSNIPQSFSLLTEFLYFSSPSFNVPDTVNYAISNIKKTIVLIDEEKIAKELDTDIEGISIYLYEDFLKEFDKLRGTEKRKEGGVYYTPQPVVKFIVNSIDSILKENFSIAKGYAGEKVKTLDFATGTGSFLAEVFNCIINQEKSEVSRLHKIKNKFLQDIYGFEMMFVPYIVAHIKLAKILKKAGFEALNDENRLQIYLTNTLDLDHRRLNMQIPLIMLEEEYEKAGDIKSSEEVLVILGNPPYNNKSKNRGEKILQLLQTYKQGLNEKKINLDDDYIKFIRFAQWKLLEQKQYTLLDETKSGVMGFITNNSFIWGRTHRKMRENLYRAFDEIYILNLHGSDKDPQDDENVFDITTGVCISLFIKHKETTQTQKKVGYFSTVDNGIFKRKEKFLLLEKSYKDIEWKELDIKEPYYWFIDKVFENNEYEEFVGIDEIFSLIGSGVSTLRDEFCIGFTKEELEKRLKDLCNIDELEFRKKYNISDSRDWKFINAKNDISQNIIKNLYTNISYRPFDSRITFYTGKSKGFMGSPQKNVANNLLLDNLSIAISKNCFGSIFDNILISKNIIEYSFSGSHSALETYVAPLYLYHTNPLDNTTTREPNFTNEFKQLIEQKPYSNATPEQILAYIYAILYSPIYREKYLEYLKIDYPKIPFTDDIEEFNRFSRIGEELIKLHLLQEIPNDDSINLSFADNANKSNPSYIIEDLKSQRYKAHTIFLNNDLCIKGVTEDIWNYTIGGYQVLDKWIKGSSKSGSRIGMQLTHEDFEYLADVCKVIKKTIEIQKELEAMELPTNAPHP